MFLAIRSWHDMITWILSSQFFLLFEGQFLSVPEFRSTAVNGMAKILIIDDDVAMRETLKDILAVQGHVVETAGTAKEAIAKSWRGFFNLALIDIKLPDIEGTELLTELKDTLPKMIKIIVTGYPSLDNAIKAVNRGADGYVLKPFQIDALLMTIEEQLRKQKEARRYCEEKIGEFILSRTKELAVPE